MTQKKIGWIVYMLLLLVSAFVLGWFAGNANVAPQIQITAADSTLPLPRQETEAKPVPHPAEPAADGPVDLNTAEQADLETLPGIGPELASRIIAYRQTIGAFVSKEQIMDVEGIGEKRYADMEQLITVGGTP